MNHIFRVIFDKTRGVFVAVSELTKSHAKAKSEQNIEMGEGTKPASIKNFILTPLYAAYLISIGAVSFTIPTDALAWADRVYGCDGQIGIDSGGYAQCDYSAGSISLNLKETTGNATGAVGFNSIAIGLKVLAGVSSSVAIGGTYNDNGKIGKSGAGAIANTDFSVVVGAGSIVNQNSGYAQTVLGSNSMGAGTQSVVVGNTSGASAQSIALGSNVFARGEGSIAIGNDDLIGTLDWKSEAAKDYIVKLPNGANSSSDTLHSIFSGLYNV